LRAGPDAREPQRERGQRPAYADCASCHASMVARGPPPELRDVNHARQWRAKMGSLPRQGGAFNWVTG
jgi:hypothetical protein